MSIRDMEGGVTDRIPVQNVLVSVADKSGLDLLVGGLMEVNPNVRFMSTGGTKKRIAEILGQEADGHLIGVAEYTKMPEMPGGLVKTLQGKVHAGILGERNNPKHQDYLAGLAKEIDFGPGGPEKVFDAKPGRYTVDVVEREKGVFIDLLVGSFYPFEKKIAEEGVTFEGARGNIDIGGPSMLRGGAKNFMSCAVITSPDQYRMILTHIRENDGCTTFEKRLELAEKVFELTSNYDRHIHTYLARMREQERQAILDCYGLGGEE